MSAETQYLVGAVVVIALVTCLTRALPFLVFGHRPLPPVIRYLGSVLPPAIMAILVCYCLRNIQFTEFPFGLAEICACAVVVVVHCLRKNMYLSIIAGTLCYMVLIRTVFPA